MGETASTLPQTRGAFMVTDGGLETDLIFNQGFELPAFASLPLVATDEGRAALRAYFDRYIAIAREAGVGIVLESPTWRGSQGWAGALGVTADELDGLNRDALALMHDIAATCADLPHAQVSGCIGPRGDGYVVGDTMDAEGARRYHSRQVGVFAEAGVDLVSALTMTYPAEAIGIVLAARDAGLPVVISFTVETDGRLPDGTPLAAAIAQVDAATGAAPAYYMINCAHPTHFERILDGGPWVERIAGVRANASTRSHAELDEAEELDEGDIDALAAGHRRLRELLPALTVIGGCCGTDHRHVRCIADAVLGERAATSS